MSIKAKAFLLQVRLKQMGWLGYASDKSQIRLIHDDYAYGLQFLYDDTIVLHHKGEFTEIMSIEKFEYDSDAIQKMAEEIHSKVCEIIA